MHRTTIELDDKTLSTLKNICVKEHKTFKKVVLEVVQHGLLAIKQSPKKVDNPLKGWITVEGPLPQGIDIADRSTYFDLIHRPLP